MGVLFDILKFAGIDDVDGINKMMSDVRRSKKGNYSSITHQATEGTLQFPVLVSSSMDIDTLQMITKGLEREYSSVVQTVMSLNPVIDYDETPEGPIGYIRQFHQNDGVKSPSMNLSTLLLSSDLDESYTTIEFDDMIMSARVYEASHAPVTKDNKEQLVDLMEDLRKDILNNKYIPSNESLFNFKDPALNAKFNNLLYEKTMTTELDPAYDNPIISTPEYIEARDKWLNKPNTKSTKEATTNEYDPAYDEPIISTPEYIEERDKWLNKDVPSIADESVISAHDPAYDQPILSTPEYLDEREKWLKEIKIESATVTEARAPRNGAKNTINVPTIRSEITHSGGFTDVTHDFKHDDRVRAQDYFKDVLADNDVRKANELVPTLLHIRLKIKSGGEIYDAVDFIIGIKAIMHPIKSEEFVINITEACNNNDRVFNFLRWTTGEISFFKDFLFSIGSTKTDVKRINGGYSTWWNALKRRRELARINKNISSYTKNKILPNATLVISVDEANFIKSNYGFDLFKPIFVDKIMKDLFLLGFVIVDESSQVAHFKFDGQKHYQSVSFAALEKENTNDARKFKEMLKTINRM